MAKDSRVAIVTGAGRGIGRSISLRLAAEGMRLALADVNADDIGELADEIRAAGGQAMSVVTDVGDEAQVNACVKAVLDEFGQLDFLVNNAGVSYKKPNGMKATVTEISLAEWESVMRINVTGVFLMSRAAVQHMLERGSGAIVNISSSAALDGGMLAASHYSCSKGAVAAFTRTLAKELAGQGIRVNAVAPGRVETPMAKLSSSERNQAALARIPMGRFAQPDEIADAVAYLLSDQSSYVTGINLNVSGGYVIA